MKIVFNYQIFFQQQYGGISNYFYHLYKELNKNKDNQIKIHAPIHKNSYLNKIAKENISGFFTKKIPSKLNPLINFYNKKISEYYIKKFKPDILHNTYYYSQKINLIKTKKFCTVYDMVNEKFPNYFTNSKEITKLKKKTIDDSDHVFCISNNTKKDLVELFNISEKKISITHLASTLKKKDYDKNKKKIFNDCLLFVGSRKGYKNFYGLCEAFSRSKLLKNNFRIISFGGEKYSYYDKNILEKFKISDKVLFFDDSNYDLSFLYQNVRAFIFPSFYEGFGLPLLEAMENNCVVISSNGGSLKEIGGKYIEYFDPYSSDDIIRVIEKILNSETLMQNNILFGTNRSKDFSWEKCAALTLKKYSE